MLFFRRFLANFAPVMQKKQYFWALILLAIMACKPSGNQEDTPHPTTVDLDSTAVTLPPRDTARANELQRRIDKELEYYLSRHNVDDEGFDMVARYAEQGDSLLAAYQPHAPVTPLGMLRLRNVKRTGTGIANDNQGRIVIAQWQADTLVAGIRIDSTGTYAGQFNRYNQAHGHGSFRSTDGTYYEGHFENDQRHGFGFAVSTSNLQAGTWKADRFVGERMQHTSDRIYGIDISRYQHERGRRRYSINWRNMRVMSLGHNKKRRISGVVDYPVSFVYIKATEGISIANRYFAADHAAARRSGIRTGAYHFFSTKQSARMQANHFLNKATFSHGDLPPMLDIEPTDYLIQKMGGPETLFREIRTWISIVEQRTGTRPLLYVNQRFVKKYLDMAPDLKENYLIWIAHYGEYKPDVHLALWQLSSDGYVQGIHGTVDINVFNGYKGQWEEFLREETIGHDK
jgi:lysozyme